MDIHSAIVLLLIYTGINTTVSHGANRQGSTNYKQKDSFLNMISADIFPIKKGPPAISKFFKSTKIIVEKTIQDQERDQCRMLPEQPFPCKNMKKSEPSPTSVHRLRPADIQVVGALGDSITAGVGARALSVLDIAKEYRGVSFSIGGQATWREVITLPNILKIFNPALYGASSVVNGEARGYNYAKAGATSSGLFQQTVRLVKDMYRDPKINIAQDWKMITILIGHNDACTHVCNSTLGVEKFEDASSSGYQHNIRKTLDYLQKYLPRTFVNLVHIADVTIILDLVHKPGYCHGLHWYFCPCLFDNIFSNRMSREEMKNELRMYMASLQDLVNTGRYDTKDDFTVVLQPSLVNGALPKTQYWFWRKELPDLSFLAPDCFHFSQKLHALVSRSLWNNLLQPVGQKSTDWSKEVPFLCPSTTAPYIATRKNSGLARRTRGSLMSDWIELIKGTKNYACTL